MSYKHLSSEERYYIEVERGNEVKKRLKRRNSIELIIGHMKSHGKLRRSYLKGIHGDKDNAILCGCGQNLCKLLNYLRQHPGVVFFLCKKMTFLAGKI